MSSTQGARKFPANISFTNTLTPKSWSQTPPAGGVSPEFYQPTLTTILGTTTATLNLSGFLTSFPPNPVYTASGSYITITSASNQAGRSNIVYSAGGNPSYMNTMQGILGISLQILGTTLTAANTPEFLTFTLPFAAQESTTLRIQAFTVISYFGTTLPSASFTISNPIYVSPSTTLTWSNITIPSGGQEYGPRKYIDIPIQSVVGSRINMNAYIANPIFGGDSFSTVNGTLTLSKTAWNLTSGGTRYVVGNNFRIDGTYFGGTSPANDIIVSVTGVNSYGAITNFTVNGTMPSNPSYKSFILDFVDSANYVRDASEMTTTNRELKIYNEKRSGSTIQGQGKVEIAQGNQFRVSYLFGQLKSGAGFGGEFNTNGPLKPGSFTNPNLNPTIIPNLFMWFDSADASTLFSNTAGTTPAPIGGTVARWNDKSGNGNNLIGSATRTAVSANPIGSDITFNGSSNGLSTTSLAVPINSTSFTYFTVFINNDSSTGYGRIVSAGTSSDNLAGDTSGLLFSNDGDTTVAPFKTYLGKGSIAIRPNLTKGAYHIVSVVFSTAPTATVFYDGVQVGTFTPASATFNFTRFSIGATIFGGNRLNGVINESIAFTSALTTTERQQVEGYLATKWGLQGGLILSHPYYIAPTPAAFVPTQFSGLTLWLDAADATTISGTSNVTQWRDKSTSLAHFNTVSGAPTYTSSREGVVFNSIDVMRTSISGTYTPGVSSLFVVTNVSGAPGGWAYVFSVGTNADNSVRYNTISPGVDGFGNTLDVNSIYLNGRQINLGLPSGILNNRSVIDGTIATSAPITLMQLGTSFNNRGLVGSIQEVLLYSSALTSGQRIQVEEYLKAKWGVVTLSPDTVPGLNLWLDASDKSTLFTDSAGTIPVSSTSQSVALWKDKSASANNATLPTSTTTPYNTGAVAIYNDNNALPTLRFSGRNGYNLSPSALPNGSSPATYFFVMNVLAGNPQEQTALFTGTYSTAAGRRFHVNIGSFRASLVNASIASDSVSLYNTSAYSVGSVTMSTTSISGWNYGSPFSINVSGNALNSSTALAQIGYLAEFPLVGNISEILIYNGELTTSQRQYVEGYLATKWGTRTRLPTAHPYYIPSPNGVIARPTFVPTSISGCALWLDAADASTITRTGANVSGWNDKSGNGFNMTHNTGTLTYNSAGFNNSPTITFGPGRSVLTRNSAFNLSGTPSLSIYTVLKTTNSSGTTRILSFWNGEDYSGGANGFNILLYNSTTTPNIGFQRGLPYSSFNPINVSGTNVFASVIFNGNVSTNSPVPLNNTGISVNGQVFTNLSGSHSISGTFSTYNPFRIGSGASVGDIFNGNISEILIFRRALTLPEHQQIEGYLAWKWGLQTKLLPTHPYYISAPSGGTAFLPIMFNTGAPIMWLDAADRDALTLSGSSVTKWWDKSGRGNNLVNASGYQIPNYNVSGFNGSPTVSFFRNNSGSFSVLQNTAFSGLSGQASMTLLFVAQRNASGATYQRFISAASTISGADNSTITGFNLNTGAGNSQFTYERNSVSLAPTFTTTNAFLGEVIVNGTGSAIGNISGTMSYIYANGSPLTISGVFAGNNFSVSHLRLGAATFTSSSNDGGNESLQGNISEMILFPRVLSTTELQYVEGYLAWKWGLQASLPANHPHFYSPYIPSPITAPFLLTNIVSPALWLDALDTSTITISGSNLTQWRDKSSSARALTPSSSTAFQYVNTFNGSLPAVFRNGVSSTDRIAQIDSGFTLNNPATIFAVFQNTDSVATVRAVFWAAQPGGDQTYLYAFNGNLHISSGAGSTFSYTGLSASTNQIITMATGASSTVLYQNGGVNGGGSTVSPSSTVNISGATINGSLGIGGLGGNNFSWFGFFSEFIIVNAALSTAQRQQIEGYLAWKWNLVGSLPTNHPYFSLKP